MSSQPERSVRLAPSRAGLGATPTALLLALALLVALAACRPETEPGTEEPTPEPTAAAGFSTNPYCAEGEVLCSNLPTDQILVPPGCADSDQQCSRNFYSWQSFVSLSWPGKIVQGQGGQVVEPDPGATAGGGGSRVWELWMDPDAVFLPGAAVPSWTPGQGPPSPCATVGAAPGKSMVGRLAKASVGLGDIDPDDFFEATVHQPLIDQALEFVVFEVRMNQQEVAWVLSNRLYQQETVQGLTTSVTLPNDAIEVKAAWRILPAAMPESQKARYYREQTNIVLSPDHVAGGGGTAPVCVQRELGLVALHVRHNGLWSTFEQVDNVTASPGITPTFNNPACTDCKTNVAPTDRDGNPIPAANYQWSLEGPSAALYEGFPNVPAQITRADGQDESIDTAMNTWFQQSVLQGTVWANYMLVTTNWIEFPTSSQPIPTLNTALEPYIPGTTFPQACIECHKLAMNDNKALIGETFMPFRACPQNPQPGQQLPPNCVPGGVTTLASHARPAATPSP
jgi:hypothetical protein